MARTAADILVETLHQWGVDTIFGLPGDGINGIMESLRKNQDKIRFVQVRHEEAAAFMACAYAKFTGRLGVCLATSGPGGLHLLNGLYDAKMDGQPVLAITGAQFHDLTNTYGQQDVPLDRVFEDVSVYNTRIMGPEHVENATNLACRTALHRRGVAHITVPADFQSLTLDEGNRSKRNLPHHMQASWERYTVVPEPGDLRQAARILNQGGRVAILAGRGARNAREELIMVAKTLGAPIIKALLGKDIVPDDSPYTTGPIGLLGTRPSQMAIEQCDTLLMIGTSFPYMEFYPKPGQARCVQIDIDPTRVGLRYPVDVGLVGDSRATLQNLLPLLEPRKDQVFLFKAQEETRQWWKEMRRRGTSPGRPMKPQVVSWELGRRLADNAIVTCDSGTVAAWWARQIPVREGQMYTLSGNLATMACGLPYAVAAQIAYPDRQVVAFVGDGAFSMLMSELATCVKYDLPIKVVVVKNDTLGQIKFEQMVFEGNPEYGCELQSVDFAAAARAFGATGITVDDPAKCGDAISQMLQTPGPVVLEAVVDPFVMPLAPKVTWEDALNFFKSLARGEPHPMRIALTATSDKVRELI